jgi:hypothetical protein
MRRRVGEGKILINTHILRLTTSVPTSIFFNTFNETEEEDQYSSKFKEKSSQERQRGTFGFNKRQLHHALASKFSSSAHASPIQATRW